MKDTTKLNEVDRIPLPIVFIQVSNCVFMVNICNELRDLVDKSGNRFSDIWND